MDRLDVIEQDLERLRREVDLLIQENGLHAKAIGNTQAGLFQLRRTDA